MTIRKLLAGLLLSTAAHTDSLATRQKLDSLVMSFQGSWQRSWRESETRRLRDPIGEAFLLSRGPLIHCHPGTDVEDQQVATYWRSGDDSFARVDFRYAQIRSSRSMFAVCPTWELVEGVASIQDERFSRDGALLPALRQAAKKQRAALLAQLDSAARLFQGDGWITGQRVRFALDQGDSQSALAAAMSCRADAWWCAALQGYTHTRRSNWHAAEQSFAEMRRAMPAADKCRWGDVRVLLAPNEQKQYSALDCLARSNANTRLWWLADPLYRVAGNERLLEEESRRVEIELHRALPQDERYQWREKSGGDALAEMIARYGWPSYTAWGGDSIDDDHNDYLESRDSPKAAPYTSFEYSLDRVHTIPAWETILNPFAAPEDNWRLSWDDPIGRPFTIWWPDEHFRPARRLVQFSEGQNAMLRRDSTVLVAAALKFDHPLVAADARFTESGAFTTTAASGVAPVFDVLLLSSPKPDRVDSLAHKVVSGGATVTLHGLFSPVPTIIAVEAQGTGKTAVDARTRFGITPPPALREMRRGDIAISDPVLFEVAGSATDIAIASDTLLEHMLGTTHLGAHDRRIGVYWETYGVSASDTVAVAVRVATDQALGGLRRLGMALNVADNPNRAIVQRWSEPEVRRNTQTVTGSSSAAGGVPIQMRAVILNLSLLQPDTYVLEVSIERRDGKVVTGRRRITVEQ